jgi:hypothetical protein
MKQILKSLLFLNLTLVLGGAECADLAAIDSGSADVTIVRGEEEPLRLIHDPLLSQVALSPPAEGFMELTFTYQDPLVYITMDINGNALTEGQQVDLPLTELTSEDANIDVEWDMTTYSSALTNAEGYLSYEILYYDDTDANVRIAFDVLLHPTTADDAEPINISGFIEGLAGQASDL